MNLKENRVSFVQCERYEVNMIKERLQDGLKPWGGLKNFVKPDQRVLLKVNLLMAKKPEEATTTHPAMVQAVAEMVKELGAKPVIGDSPAGPFSRALVQRTYKRTGMEAAANGSDAELNWNFDSIEKSFPEGKILKNMTLGQYVTEADVIINMPKLKTHGMTRMTGGVKNLFGTIPGLIKAEYHLKMQDIQDFSDVLIDIALAVAPQLTIMDGIIGMEGEGPSGGEPIELNSIFISPNPFALDVAVAKLVQISPDQLPVIKMAGERGLAAQVDDIEILGDSLVPLQPKRFSSPDVNLNAKLLEKRLPDFLARGLNRMLKPKPIFDPNICIQCGDCIRSCPPQVIEKAERGVKVDLDDCIRCFCCQEVCPKRAVEIKRPLLGKLLFRK